MFWKKYITAEEIAPLPSGNWLLPNGVTLRAKVPVRCSKKAQEASHLWYMALVASYVGLMGSS